MSRVKVKAKNLLRYADALETALNVIGQQQGMLMELEDQDDIDEMREDLDSLTDKTDELLLAGQTCIHQLRAYVER
jgi:hypothetical protein